MQHRAPLYSSLRSWSLFERRCELHILFPSAESTPMSEFRTEHDSMGDVQVPAKAYYGAQTQRAVENFPVSGWTLRSEMIRAMGLVKWAAGVANRDLGK